ncbi:DUF4432 family protein [uncultured Cohaesibacter sp.]|uniref:DUF4432 family protein n=1 Tax=uncultured Cohaesibacter sp. TaxID=1002546 RepID=UPI0029C7F411|nr:DUF4432 family protein [uncultured Cohaesibacter sp.]
MTSGRVTELRHLTGNLQQLAAVRSIVLDDGPSLGQRALAFSTGGGLDFWVYSDRTMDIGPLWFHGMPVAWQHPAGMVSPTIHDAHRDHETGIERALTGFLLTCGLDNVRQPQNGLPLHGTLPFTPARVTTYGEDWNAPTPVLFAEGTIVSAHLGGASFSLLRRIEAPIGGTTLSVIDTIENIGPEPSPFRILYHTNFGFPAVGAGTRVLLNDEELLKHEPSGNKDHAQQARATCHQAGSGRFCAVLERPASGQWHGIRISVEGNTEQLPYVQLWSDPRPYRNIVAIEPANCDRRDDGTSMDGMMLQPAERWTSTLTYSFTSLDAVRKGAPNGNG